MKRNLIVLALLTIAGIGLSTVTRAQDPWHNLLGTEDGMSTDHKLLLSAIKKLRKEIDTANSALISIESDASRAARNSGMCHCY